MNLQKLRAAAIVFFVGFALGLSVFAASRLFVRSILSGDAVAAAEVLASRLADGEEAAGGAGFPIISQYRLIAPDGRVLADGSQDRANDVSAAAVERFRETSEPVVRLSPLGPSLLGLTEPAVQEVVVPAIASDGMRVGTLHARFDQRMTQASLSRAFTVVGIATLCLGMLAFTAIILIMARGRRGGTQAVADLGRLPHDPLTGALTRRSFEASLSAAVARAAEQEAQLALVAIDIDGLRQVNNTWGHNTGDTLLRQVSERLATYSRGTAQLARIGSDEFVLMIEGEVHSPPLRTLAGEIVAALAAPYEINGATIHLGARAGIAQYPVNATDTETLFRAAGIALSRAKTEARQTVIFFDTDMQRTMERRTSLERDLRKALEEDQFVVFYQPQLDLESGQLRGYEALIRWNRPGEGIVGPAEFLSVAEETGLIRPIGEWVLRKACEDASSWLDSGSVAVNFSRAEFRDGNLAATIEAVLKETGLAPERLEVEVPEGLFLEHRPDIIETLHRIKGLGVRVAMDNFGKGYSGLASLVSFPFDKLKIDRSFVGQLLDDPEVATIVASIIGLGRSLSVDITAEGVESSEQVAILKAAGCSIAQGFLFGAPQRDALGGAQRPSESKAVAQS